MRTTIQCAIVAAVFGSVVFPTAVATRPHAGRLIVPAEPACDVRDAVPEKIAAMPGLSQAIAEARRVTIVAIGSSSTEGVGASSPNASYPSQLHAMLQLAMPEERFDVVNLGIGGETAAQAAARLRTEVPKLAPDLVVWQLGTNDALAGVPVAEYEATVRDALRLLKAARRDTLLVGVQWTRRLEGDAAYSAVRDATARVAESEGVSLVSRYDAMRKLAEMTGREEFVGKDGLHMNDSGYRCMADEIGVTIAQAVDKVRNP